MSLTFDAATHTYSIMENGKRVVVPSVTQALQVAGLIPEYTGDKFYSERGTEVHKACEYLDTGKLAETDIETLDERIQPYVWSYWHWRREAQPEWKFIEKEFYHSDDPRYAGRIDRLGSAAGHWYVIDLKTSSPKWYHAHQLALYARGACSDGLSGIPRCAGLYLQADGGAAVLKEYGDHATEEEALSAVRIWHARAKHTRGGNPKIKGECEE